MKGEVELAAMGVSLREAAVHNGNVFSAQDNVFLGPLETTRLLIELQGLAELVEVLHLVREVWVSGSNGVGEVGVCRAATLRRGAFRGSALLK
jgi:hypothetical protein